MSRKFNKKKEDLPKYAQSLEKLARKAYPGSKLSDRQLCDYFTRGLPNEMRRQVALMRPATLDDCLVFALTCEAVDGNMSDDEKPKKPKAEPAHAVQEAGGSSSKRSKRRKKGKAQKPSNQSEAQVVAAANAAPAAPQANAQLLQVLESLTKLAKEQMDTLTNLSKRIPERRPLSEVTCHGCGQKGHYRNTCRNPTDNQQAPQPQAQPRFAPSAPPFRPQQRSAMVEEEMSAFQGN